MNPLRVLLCDDEILVLEALALALEALGFEVVGATPDPQVALALACERRPDLCVLDAHFPEASGPAIAATMHECAPGTQIVMLTADATEGVWAAYDVGALDAVLNKTLDVDSLFRAIMATARGERVVAGWRRVLVPSQRRPDEVDALTDRELEVLAALVRGSGTTDIAGELSISVHTVRSHVQSLMRKLGVTTRAKATRVAVASGLLQAS